MREIEFRAWDKKKKVYTNWKCYDNMFYFMDKFTGVWIRDDDFERFVLIQYTGLKDKNGTEIYEGDICNCREYECFGKVEWNNEEAGFYFCVVMEGGGFEEEHLYDYVDELEVIGNIYENPDLLGEPNEN